MLIRDTDVKKIQITINEFFLISFHFHRIKVVILYEPMVSNKIAGSHMQKLSP